MGLPVDEGSPQSSETIQHGPPPTHPRGNSLPLAALILLAVGVYGVLASGLFLLPFVLSPYAIQNDVYGYNLFLGPAFLGIGGTCTLCGLVVVARSRTPRRWQIVLWATVLAVAGAAILTTVYLLFGGHYVSEGQTAVPWPVYLTGSVAGLALVIGLAVVLLTIVLAWVGRRRAKRAHQTSAGS